jgi:hypothetical protein
MSEKKEQIAVVKWFELQYPHYAHLLVHIPNEGSRTGKTGTILKMMGFKTGFLDLFLAVQNKKYGGLFIEMKSKAGKLSDEQIFYLEALKKEGYLTAVCYNWNIAKTYIEKYMADRKI